MLNRAIDECDVVETLDAVESLFDARLVADAEMFERAAHFADLHSGDSLRADGRSLPGMERAVQVGGAGTPSVAEFCVAELGARMRMGSWAGRIYLADSLDTRHRLPLCWEKVRSREARVPFVRLVASRTRHLSVAAAAYVDAAMAEHLDGSLPWGRFESRLDGKIVAADPETAAAREAARAAEQFAKRTRSSEDGTAGFYVRSTAGVIARVDATVALVADALKAFGDADNENLRRVKAMVLLCNPAKAVELLAAFAASRSRTTDVALPLDDEQADRESDEGGQGHDERGDGERGDDETGEASDSKGPERVALDALDRVNAFARKVSFSPIHLPAWLAARLGADGTERPRFSFDWSALLPPITMNLHLAAETLQKGGGGVARWEGEGPVTHQFVHDHLRPLHRYVIQPVIDLAAQAPVDAYEIPDRHRKAVHLRTPADCSPFSSSTTRKVDIDHTEEYIAAPEGAPEKDLKSRLDNYGPLGKFNHRVKTHGHWTVKQPFAGIYLWRDPHGQVYLVDHAGTRKVTRPDHPAGPKIEHDYDLHLHQAEDVVLEVDFGRAAG